jgi:molybdate transport system substrate-binding protein
VSRLWLVALLAAFALVLAVPISCASRRAPEPTSATASTSTAASVTGRVTVFAASSLTDVFKQLAIAFEQATPNVTVQFNFASSSALEAQIEQGAPADVFASADAVTMDRAAAKSLVDGTPAVFAKNRPVIVVPADNRAGIATAKDLSRPGTRIVLAAFDVPIGNYARQIVDKLAADPAYGPGYKDAVLKNVVSNESNVRAVLAKIELGEADAGVVYQTDARVSGAKVKTVAIPDSANVVAMYPIAVVQTARNKDAATAFVQFMTGTEAQAALKAAGFESAR